MRKFLIFTVDAFSSEPFKGNPAAVVLEAQGMSEEERIATAKEMNLSETAFVLPSDKASFRLQYITRGGDKILFCGHATVAALLVLERMGLIHRGEEVLFETPSGILSTSIQEEDNVLHYRYKAPTKSLQKAPFSLEELSQESGFEKGIFDSSVPLCYDPLNRYTFACVDSLDLLQKLEVDFSKLNSFARKHDIVVFSLVSRETVDQNKGVHARGFATMVGVDEDPFTGSLQGGLAQYAQKYLFGTQEDLSIVTEQGDVLGRPGRAQVSIHLEKGAPIVEVSARATLMLQGELQLPKKG